MLLRIIRNYKEMVKCEQARADLALTKLHLEKVYGEKLETVYKKDFIKREA